MKIHLRNEYGKTTVTVTIKMEETETSVVPSETKIALLELIDELMTAVEQAEDLRYAAEAEKVTA